MRLLPSNGSFIDYSVFLCGGERYVGVCTIRCEQHKWWRDVEKKRKKKTKMITPYNQFDNLIQSQICNRKYKCDIIKSIWARSAHSLISRAGQVYWWATATTTAYQISYYYFASILNKFPSAPPSIIIYYYFLGAIMCQQRPHRNSTKWHFKIRTIRSSAAKRMPKIHSSRQSFSSNFSVTNAATRQTRIRAASTIFI